MKSPLITLPASVFLLFTLLGCIMLAPAPEDVESSRLQFAATISGAQIDGPFEVTEFSYVEGVTTLIVTNGTQEFWIDIEGDAPSFEEDDERSATVRSRMGGMPISGVGVAKLAEHADGILLSLEFDLAEQELSEGVRGISRSQLDESLRVGLIMCSIIMDDC